MSRSEAARGPSDWRSWLLVAWVATFGAIYAANMVRAKAPGLAAKVEARLGL